MRNINVTRSSMPLFEEYCQEIKELWDTHWLTNMGKKHQQLEGNLKQYLDTENITLFSNGHLALENILEAYHLPEGSEVITTPFTFASTTHAIVRKGLKPVFCDINENDYTMDVTQIEEKITPNTVAILPVHVYGNICDVEGIEELAKKHHLKVIYDAAHAFGVKYKGRSIATYGDAAMFSFHATKVFHTIEGGAVCYKEKLLTRILDDLKNFGIHDAETVQYVGGNAKMNEFSAAMGICNLRHIEEETEKRKKIVSIYRKRLLGVCGIKTCEEQTDVISNYAYFPVVFEDYKWTRDEVFERLKNKGVGARKYFYPLITDMNCYKGREGFDSSDTPVAKRVSNNVLTLPLYADLAQEVVEEICRIILG